MAKKIIKSVQLSKIHFEEDFYPRTKPNWQTSYIYSENIKSGSKFPPITLAFYKKKLYLVDGKHRYEAHKRLGKNKINAEIFIGWNKEKIFEEAVKRNVAHGLILSPYEKRLIILKLRSMKYKDNAISKLVNVPQEKLITFVGERLISSTTGKVIVDTIVKSAFKHKAGGQYSQQEIELMEKTQGQVSTRSQVYLISQLVEIFNNNLIDINDELIYKQLLMLKAHLKNVK